MKFSSGSDPSLSILLASLGAEAVERLAVVTERVELYDVLFEAEDLPDVAYFPSRGTVISVTLSTHGGSSVETAVVGFEGFVSVRTLLSPTIPERSAAIIQSHGNLSIVSAAALRNECNRDENFRNRLLAFSSAFLDQVSQNVLCNRLHNIEKRLAKWLMMMSDRVESNQFDVTHDFIATMLGIQRSGVTLALGSLTLDGLIEHSRSLIRIRNHEGLRHAACECYDAILDAFELATARPPAPAA